MFLHWLLQGRFLRGGAVTVSVVTLFALVGCTAAEPTTDSDLQALVQQAISARTEIFAQKQNITFDFALDSDTDEGAAFQKLEASGTVNGYFFSKPSTLPQLDVDVTAEFMSETPSETQEGSLAFGAVLTDDSFFINLTQVPEPLLNELAPLVEQFKGTWWRFVLPADLVAAAQAEVDAVAVERINGIIAETTFFDNLVEVGTEQTLEGSAKHVSGKFSKEGLVTYVEEISSLSDAPQLTRAEQEEMNLFLTILEEAQVDLWILDESKLITKIAIKFTEDFADLAKILGEDRLGFASEGLLGTIDLSIEIESSDFGVEEAVVAPADAQDFDAEKLFAPLETGQPLL